jgi:signal transduction histidine kinase
MVDAPVPDLAIRRRVLRRVIGQAYIAVVILLLVSLPLTPSTTPMSVRAAATVAVLLVGAAMAEGFVRLMASRYPTLHLPRTANVIGAVLASLAGFAIALGVQWALGYPVPITVSVITEALISAPIWLIFAGTVTAGRWRYLSLREGLMDELVRIESARAIERDALTRARVAMAETVRPSLMALRSDIDEVLSAPAGHSRSDAAASLRRAATTVVRPLSHATYAQANPPNSRRRPLQFIVTTLRTQPFRPVLVSVLYLATALPRNIEEYGIGAATAALAIDVAFILLVLGGANLILRRSGRWHAWVYVATLVVIHVIPLLLVLPDIADTDPQFTGIGVLLEIVISVALLVGTSSLGLFDARRNAMLEQLSQDVSDQQISELGEAAVLAMAARELGARLHGPVQSQVLAAAASLERAAEASEDHSHSVLAEAAEVIDAVLREPLGSHVDVPLDLLLREVAEPWQEICSVAIALDPGLGDLTGVDADAVGSVVREAIVNAYRHGNASRIAVAVESGDGALLIRVTDDGVGATTKGWGLGLTLIDRLTGGHWTLTREADTTVLVARVNAGNPSR